MVNENNNNSEINDSVIISAILAIGGITIAYILKDSISEISISDTCINLKAN